eukprot:gene6832-10997_t
MEFKNNFKKTFEKFPQFKEKVKVCWLGWPYYVKDENYSISNHIQEINFEESINLKKVEEIIAKFASKPLSKEKPLWQAILIQNYKNEETDAICSVVVMKYYHSIADGFSSIHLLLNLCTTKNKEKTEENVKSRKRIMKKRSILESTKDFIGSTKCILYPEKDTETLFSVKDAEKQSANVSISNSILTVKEVKQIAKKNNATINDEQSGSIFCIQSANVSISTVVLDLPVKEESSKSRLFLIHETLDNLILSFEPILSKILWILVGLLPGMLIKWITKFFGERSTFSYSNVPGPIYELDFCGDFFCFISYNDHISASTVSCDELSFKSEEYYKYFKQEFELLK